MLNNNDFFSPEDLDGQLEISLLTPAASNGVQESQTEDANKLLLQDLYRFYRSENNANTYSLQRVWERLEQRISEPDVLTMESGQLLQFQKRSETHPQLAKKLQKRGQRTPGRGMAVLAAILFLGIMVGSLFTIVHFTRPGLSATGLQATTSVPTEQPTLPPGYPYAAPGRSISTLPVSSDDFYALSWSPDETRVAAATLNKAWVWNIATAKYATIATPSVLSTPSVNSTTEDNLRSLVWSPDGSRLAIGTNPVQIVSPIDGTISGQAIPVYVFWPKPADDLQATITALAWSPDNTMLAVAALRSGDNGCVTQIWSVEPQLLLKTLDCQNAPNGVSSLSWSADGHYVAAANGLNVEVWDWNAQINQIIFSQSISNETNVAWSSESNILAFVNSTTTQVWDVSTQTMVSQYPNTRNGVLSWSPDGRYLATANESQVILWDTTNGTHIYTYTGNFHYVRALAWSPRGNYLVSGESSTSGYNFAHIWTA